MSRVRRDRRVQLVDDPCIRQARVEGQVARPGPRPGRDERRSPVHERSRRLVDSEYEQPIESLVRNDEEPAEGVERALVRVRPRLLGAVRARLALRRHDVGGCAERTIREDRQYLHRSRHVVDHDHESSRRVDGHVARIVAARGLVVDEVHVAGPFVHGERRHLVRHRLDGIQERTSRVEGQIPRVDDVRQQLDSRPLPGRRADGVDGQAFAMGAAGAGRERPDVGKAGPRGDGRAGLEPGVVRGSGVRRSRGASRGCRDPRGGERQHLPAGGRSRAFRIVGGHDGLYATAGNQGCFAAKTTNLPCPTSLMSGCNRPRPELQAIVRTPMS